MDWLRMLRVSHFQIATANLVEQHVHIVPRLYLNMYVFQLKDIIGRKGI